MGRWFARFLLKDGKEVVLADRNEKKLLETKEELGVEVTSNLASAVENADAVLISVPIESFETVVKELKPHITPGQTVFDITSVKAFPVDVMHRHIGAGLILGTHPVFGPGAKGIRNQNFVLTPTNEQETALARKIKQYLEERGGEVTLTTPEEHDEMMAVILGLSHFIAIASADTLLSFDRLKEMKAIGGPTYKALLTLAESVITEDPELYASIQMNLPGITEKEELFQRNTKTWAEIVRNRDRQEFVERMNALKNSLENTDPDFGRSYEDIYRLLERA